MAVQKIIDVTDRVNNGRPIEIGGWDYATLQIIEGDDTSMAFFGSNDSGAIEGVTEGNPDMAIKFDDIQVLDLFDMTYKSSIDATSNNVKIDAGVRFFKTSGNSVVTKALLRVYKIN